LLEDQHQKAADLLTILSFTNNFFVLSEPETPKSNVTVGLDTRGKRHKNGDDGEGQHHVISALTSWIGQGEARLVALHFSPCFFEKTNRCCFLL